MMPLAGKPLVQNVIERVMRAKRLDEVVLAVPDRDFGALNQGHWQVFSCSSLDDNDLVGRYLACAEHFHADVIVRICADNPCIEPEYIDQAVETYLEYPFVFFSNTTEYVKWSARSYNGAWVDGIGAEVFSLSRLKWLDEATKGKPTLREHPHRIFDFPLHEADVRLDVNTKGDYDFLADIYNHFGNNKFHVSEVLEYLHVTG